jgi:hypothetical protein
MGSQNMMMRSAIALGSAILMLAVAAWESSITNYPMAFNQLWEIIDANKLTVAATVVNAAAAVAIAYFSFTLWRVYDGRTFKAERFAGWLAANNIPWPLLESGNLDLSDDTFRHQARAYPAVSPLRELRSSLSDLRLNDLARLGLRTLCVALVASCGTALACLAKAR